MRFHACNKNALDPTPNLLKDLKKKFLTLKKIWFKKIAIMQ